MKRWAIPLAAGAIIAVMVVAGVAFALISSGNGSDKGDEGGRVISDPHCAFAYGQLDFSACERAVDLAKHDLAARLGTSAENITETAVEFTQWPDACLGISRPGAVCAEVITPGYRIMLRANEVAYEYHTEGDSRVQLAE